MLQLNFNEQVKKSSKHSLADRTEENAVQFTFNDLNKSFIYKHVLIIKMYMNYDIFGRHKKQCYGYSNVLRS